MAKYIKNNNKIQILVKILNCPKNEIALFNIFSYKINEHFPVLFIDPKKKTVFILLKKWTMANCCVANV